MKNTATFILAFFAIFLSFSELAQCPVKKQASQPVIATSTGSAPGGNSTVTISVSSGAAPFIYSIIKSPDINYPDAQSVYTNNAVKTVAGSGVYQVRVKDICGKFYTKTVAIGLSAANRETGMLCPTSIVATVTTTDADCPSSGSATVNVANPGLITCMLLSGPSGATLNVPQASKVFNALLPGNYTVTAFCNSYADTVAFTIHDNYIPISNVAATVTASCGSYSPGGTITITATGGTSPLSYSIIKSADPNYADSLSIYTASSTKLVTSFGTYQVRVKDACNQFYTTTVQVTASLNPAFIVYSHDSIANCNPSFYSFFCQLLDGVTNQEINGSAYNALGGVRLRVYEQAAGSCGPTGPVLLDLASAPYHGEITVPVVSSKKYFSQVITPCGDTMTSCYDASGAEDSTFTMTTSVSGCGSVSNPLLETISPDDVGPGIVFPLTIKLYLGTDATGTLMGTRVVNSVRDLYNLPGAAQFQGLTPATYYMVSTDACGNVNTQVIADPTGAGSPFLNFAYFGTDHCTGAGITTKSGTATIIVDLLGYLPDVVSAKAVIISGPGSIGDTATTSGNQFIWINIAPGTYTAEITTSCGPTDLQFTVPVDTVNILNQNISATATSTCSAGSGAVTATTNYNGAFTASYVLINASSNTPIDSNSNGNFLSVTAGQYYVRLKLINNSTYASCINTAGYSINSNTVTIAPAGAGPVITKKLGVTCEDASGTPMSSGTAYLSIAGASPLLVEYKLTSTSTWTTFSANAPMETAITGLTAGSIYDVRVTSCGITAATQVTIGQPGTINTTNNQQPCIGNAYELDLPQLAGASYQWQNASGNIISNSYNYSIAFYDNSYNGQYVGTVTWGTCAKRTDTVTLNSLLCGSLIVLPVSIRSFTASAQNCVTILNWTTSAGLGIKIFNIERSANGVDYTTIADVAAGNYNYTDNTALQGTAYYRLKMIDINGRYVYSDIIKVNTRCNSVTTQWSVYPALVNPGSTVTVKLNTSNLNSSAISIVVTSITGQRAYSLDKIMHPGQNIYTLPENNLVPGTYLLCIYDNKLQRIGGIQKIIYTR